MINVSFSPASIAAPSSLNNSHFFLSTVLGQPFFITNSLKASLVPEVGGGTNTDILIFGKLESMSDHFSCFEPCSASACHICSTVKLTCVLDNACMIAIPSKPILTSVISVIPFFLHNSTSLDLMARLAFVISGELPPIPLQNNFIPPPVPVDSITGVLKPDLPNLSDTTVANG